MTRRFASILLISLAVKACTCGGATRAGAISVDARIELLSTVFRLAGNEEYRRAEGPYADAVLAHFAPFAGHDAVTRAAALKQRFGVSFDAPLQLALHLNHGFAPLVPLDPMPASLAARWKGADVSGFAAALRAFAAASRFEEFLRAWAPYHQRVVASLEAAVPTPALRGWFDAVFGARPSVAQAIAAGLQSGPMAYSLRAALPGREVYAQVLMLEAPDADGVPHPTERTTTFLVHEIAHAYANPVIDGRRAELEPALSAVFRAVEPAMRRQQYPTPAIMASESLVRALTILYLRERGSAAVAASQLAEELRLSFFWTAELTDALAAARKNGGGRLGDDAMLAAVRGVFAAWSSRTAPPR